MLLVCRCFTCIHLDWYAQMMICHDDEWDYIIYILFQSYKFMFICHLLNTFVLMFRQSSACKSGKHLKTILSGHFLHSCLELTWIEISRGHVEAHLTIAPYMQSVSPLG